MGLKDLIRKTVDFDSVRACYTATPATPATPQGNSVQGVASVASVAVAKALNSIMLKIPALTLEEKELLHAWLADIGETNPEAIARVIHQCQEDMAIRNYFLEIAMAHKATNIGGEDDRRYCHQCVNLSPTGQPMSFGQDYLTKTTGENDA